MSPFGGNLHLSPFGGNRHLSPFGGTPSCYTARVNGIAKVFRILALLVSVAGFVCLYLDRRPADLPSAAAAVTALITLAVADVRVPALAAAALVTFIVARLVESTPTLGQAEPPAAKIEPASSFPEPNVLARGGGEIGPRLAKRLRGRPDVPAFVDDLLGAAVAAGASDVHVKPTDVETSVAWRVRGELADVVAAPKHHHQLIVRRLKILAQLTTYQTDLPQDGRFKVESVRGDVDVRMSVLPTRHGGKVALRLTRAGHGLIMLDRLGIPEPLIDSCHQLLAERQGLIVLTGPTGCGKTTTMYGSLAHIHEQRGSTTSIATIEDPVEIDLPYLSQTQVDPATGLTFAASLRAVLRQDPNVLMVGEIRDTETAHIAVEAGLTGHLILTTLHAESTAGVFNRLIDMGIEPFLASSSVLAALSQRLARRLCHECRQPEPRDRSTTDRLIRQGLTRTAADSLSFFSAPGCEACGHSGVSGRTAIFELLLLTPPLRDLIANRVSTHQIEEAALGEGMTPLFRAAILEAVDGTISLDEALRVAG